MSAYLPLDMPPQVARQIERVFTLADRPIVRRPLTVAAVQDALPAACERDSVLCEQVERYLARYTRRIAVTDAQLELATSGGESVPLANRRGLDSGDEWTASAEARWQLDEHVSIGIGAIARRGEMNPAGSMISMGTSYAQVDLGFREHWSSSLVDSSFLMSSEAPVMPSVTLSNSRPLGSAGFSYEVYVARMERSDLISYQGGFTTGHPQLAGMQLAIAPVPGWSLGFNRQLQFGGGERSGNNATDLLKAFFNPSGGDNTRAGGDTDEEFGNQRAAWTSRFIYPGRNPLVISLEYAGEDTSHSTSGRLGNAALSMGIYAPGLWRDVDFTYEISEWQNGWSGHHIYQDGMTNDGRALGHWGMDRRAVSNNGGARSQMLRLGWTTPAGRSVDLQFRTLKNAGYSSDDGRMNELGARYSWPLRNMMVGGELLLGQDVSGDKYVRVAASTRLFDGGGGIGPGESASYHGETTDGASIFADVGIAVSRVRMDIDETVPVANTSAQAAPHLALGVRRAVSSRGDLGVRIEFDRIEDHTLLSVRALDYRYRVGRRLALTAFAGAARYDVETPAYGYYLGTGVQWRDVLPKWDLNLDLRYGDKIARDHVLPDESGLTRPDSFYDISSVSLSVSRRL